MKRVLIHQLPFVAVAAFGCANVLGLDDFGDAPAAVAGGAAGAGGTAGGGPTGGAAGSGGETPDGGDAGPNIVCTETSVMDVFAPADFVDAQSVDLKSLRIIRSFDDANTVHVTISYKTNAQISRLAIRTYQDGDSQPGALNLSDTSIRTRAGAAKGGVLRIYGVDSKGFVRLDYALNGASVGSGPPASAAPLTTPQECSAGSENQTVFEEDPTSEEFATTCEHGSPAQRSLFVVSKAGSTKVETVDSPKQEDPRLKVRGYVHSGAKLLVATDGGAFYEGLAPATLTKRTIDLTNGAGDLSAMFATVPLSGVNGALVMPARVSLSPISGTLYAGVFPVGDYDKLGDKTRYAPVLQISDVSKLPKMEKMYLGEKALVGAGVSADGQQILFYKFTRDGKTLAGGFAVPSATNLDDTMAADAATLGFANDVVVWTEKGTIPKVRAARLLCAPK